MDAQKWSQAARQQASSAAKAFLEEAGQVGSRSGRADAGLRARVLRAARWAPRA
jgi:hypothetical protein